MTTTNDLTNGLRVGGSYAAHFGCDCGDDHTPDYAHVTVVALTGEGDDRRVTLHHNGDDYDFDVYMFDGLLAYGSDADPITFSVA